MALSAPLLTRKRVIKVKIETTKGTAIAGDQAIRVFDLDIKATSPFEQRNGTGLYLGNNNTGILGARTGSCTFSMELQTDGSQAMEAGLAILLQACGLAKTLEVYQVHSSHANQKTISIDISEDGIKKSLIGCMGNVTFEGESSSRMMCNFEFFGIWVAPTDVALPAYAPATRAPLRLQGGTWALGAESIKIGKYSLNMGNVVVPRYDVDSAGGVIYYMITDYDPTLSVDPEADLVAGYDFNGLWLAGTEAAASMKVDDGTDSVTFSTPKVQIKELSGGDREGILTYEYVGQCNHSSGDDSVVITAAAT